MNKIFKLTLLFVFIVNIAFTANLDSKRGLFAIKSLNETAKTLGYKIGDIFIDNIPEMKFGNSNYLPTAFGNILNTNCGYDKGNYGTYMAYYIHDDCDKLIYRPSKSDEILVLGEFICLGSLSTSDIEWTTTEFEKRYTESIKKHFINWFSKEKKNIDNRYKKKVEEQKKKEEKELAEKYADIEAFLNDDSTFKKIQEETKREIAEENIKLKILAEKRNIAIRKEYEKQQKKLQEEREQRLLERGNREPTLSEKQALIKARSYLNNVGGFSRSGMIKQLEFEGFTYDEAEYAVDMLGY